MSDSVDIFRWVCYTIVIMLLLAMGWVANEAYRSYNHIREYDGLSFSNVTGSHADILKVAYGYDAYGNWVCVNVNGMNFKRAYQTCVHECTHNVYSEIFAEKCEENYEVCDELIKQESKKNGLE
jgi:hypothetical protein